MTDDAMPGRKPAMRPLTPGEVRACRSCDTFGQSRWPIGAPIPPGAVCWFGCETPIDESIDPMWCVTYANPAAPDGAEPDLYRIEDTCCGKCPGGTCYVDQVTGA